MNPTLLRLFVACTLLLTLAPSISRADDAVTLRYKWTKGEVIHQRMTMTMTSQMSGGPLPVGETSATSVWTSKITVLDVAPSGTGTIEFVITSVKLDLTLAAPTRISYDSSKSEQPDTAAAMLKPISAILNTPLTMEIAADGGISQVKGAEKLVEKLGQDSPMVRQMMDQLLKPDNLKQMMGPNIALPTKPVKVGDTWPFCSGMTIPDLGMLASAGNALLTDLQSVDSHRIATIHVASTMSLQPTPNTAGVTNTRTLFSGFGSIQLQFDATAGRLVRATARQSQFMDVTATPKTQGASPSSAHHTLQSTMIIETIDDTAPATPVESSK